MSQKIVDRYVDKLSFHKVSRIETTVMLQRKAETTIDKVCKGFRKEPVEEEKLRTIQTSAQLIRDEIKSVDEVYFGEYYPSFNSINFPNTEAVIASSLKCFLSCLITNKDQSTKIVATGHSTKQATFPRTSTVPLPIVLAVHLQDHFVSKYLIHCINLRFVKHTKSVTL